jgi:predicted  nucleic acid-binding Zn-ribbon protein
VFVQCIIIISGRRRKRNNCADRLEQGLTTTYNRIPNNAQATERSAEEKINLIAQTIDQYRQEIEELKERLNPTTPPEVREQRKEEVALQMVEWRNK